MSPVALLGTAALSGEYSAQKEVEVTGLRVDSSSVSCCGSPEPDGDVIAFPEVGGLHHRYERRAA